MNPAHFHLMINHLPVIGLLIATGLLGFGILRRHNVLVQAGLWLVVVTSFSALPAYLSGEGAEEIVEHMPGISEALIHDHEELAELGLIVSLITGLLSLAVIIAGRRSRVLETRGPWLVLGAGFLSFGVLALVANTGGLINHPELRDSSNISYDDSDD